MDRCLSGEKEVLRALFSRYGLPLELVSDNGPQLVAGEFQTFLKMNYFQKHNNAFQFSEHVSMFQTSSSAIMNIC